MSIAKLLSEMNNNYYGDDLNGTNLSDIVSKSDFIDWDEKWVDFVLNILNEVLAGVVRRYYITNENMEIITTSDASWSIFPKQNVIYIKAYYGKDFDDTNSIKMLEKLCKKADCEIDKTKNHMIAKIKI